MGLQSFHAGMTWLQYDWKESREMNADGSLSWQRQDQWQLVSRLSGSGTLDDPFAPAQSSTGMMGGQSIGRGHRQGSSRGRQAMPRGRQTCLNKACSLFNRASAGCHYGKKCIYAHRCTQWHSEEHGRQNCPSLNTKGDRSGQFHCIN